MTKKEIQMLADLIFDRIVEKQEQMDEDYHNQVRKLYENGFIIDDATDKFLDNKKSPSRKVGELDNRGSHFYLATYWAEALANQDKNIALKNRFAPIAKELAENTDKIVNELNAAQGSSLDIKGYYFPNEELTSKEMRPSNTLNTILNGF
jgi:isocitrate dehydrogenase